MKERLYNGKKQTQHIPPPYQRIKGSQTTPIHIRPPWQRLHKKYDTPRKGIQKTTGNGVGIVMPFVISDDYYIFCRNDVEFYITPRCAWWYQIPKQGSGNKVKY